MKWCNRAFVFYEGPRVKEGNLTGASQIHYAEGIKDVERWNSEMADIFPTGMWYEHEMQWNKKTESFTMSTNPKMRKDLTK